jgi:hypothetical protein
MASSFLYTIFKTNYGLSLFSGARWDDVAASYYITLLTNGYTPNEGHPYASAWSGFELSGGTFSGGYAPPSGSIRIPLSGRTVFSNTTSFQAEFRASNLQWSGISAGTAVAYGITLQAGSNGNSPLVVYCSLGGFPIITVSGNVPLSFANSGVFVLTD